MRILRVIRNYGKLQLGCSNKILERLFAITYFLMHGACPGILHADNEKLGVAAKRSCSSNFGKPINPQIHEMNNLK